MAKHLDRFIKKHSTPKQVQLALRKMSYNHEPKGETLRSAEAALAANIAHCFEATFIAAATLEHYGHTPALLSLESKDGIDHILFLFQEKGKWGTISRSRDQGLHGRAPVYKTIQQLVWSYYDPYVDKTGELVGFEVVHLDELPGDWRNGTTNLWAAEKYIIDLKHQRLRASKKRYRKLFARYKSKGPLPPQKNWW
jgi:hypothetical protein